MISLGLLVDTKNINKVKVLARQDVEGYMFDVGSAQFEEKKNWIVKGDYLIEEDVTDKANVLVVEKLEKDIEVTIGKPIVVANDSESMLNAPEDKLEQYINTPVTAIVFHRSLLISSARDTKKRFVTAYAEACLESYQRTNPQATRDDFAVIEIDWSNKSVSLNGIAPEEKKEESI